MDVVDRLNGALKPDKQTWIDTGEVTNAAAGTFPDGRRKITVTWRGVDMDCAYNRGYTPANGDLVTFLKDGSSVVVICAVARA